MEIGKNILLGTSEKEIVNFVNNTLENPEILENMRKVEAPILAGAAEKIISIIKIGK
ncbi:MAG TPA: hypothetical protein PLC38_00935 [Methanobacterium sp.]|nr:hypothetical protein [Methanobacterium sp.]